MDTATVYCDGKTTRDINREIKQLIAEGSRDIRVVNPAARHNLGVAIVQPVRIVFDGSVGYYCAGMVDGATVEVKGSAGWGVAESMMGGAVIVEGNAGNGAAASMRGGAVVVHGDAAARAGVSIKGGTLIIAGNCGYMTGFMGQRGSIIVCGNAAEAFADSMYETVCFVGGSIKELGNDAIVQQPTAEELEFLNATLLAHKIDPKHAWTKIVSGRKLWNFDKSEMAWREAL